MQIKEITLNNFGKYKAPDKPLIFKDGINVVYGPNEAGKSTLFNGLLTLIYGFKPTKKDLHPYLGWEESKIDLAGCFEDAQGTFMIERILASNPVGRMTRDGKEIKIDNRPITPVRDISKQTFEAIYALRLQDIVKMSEKPWSEIEDRLILNYGIEGIKSPREVLLELEEEMKKIYNPRGQAKNTQVKVFEREIKALKDQRKQILNTQWTVKEKEKVLVTLNDTIAQNLEREASLESEILWWEKHQPLHEMIEQIKAINDQITGLGEAFNGVPEKMDDYYKLKEKWELLKDKEDKLLKEKVETEGKIQTLSPLEQNCINHEARIRSVMKEILSYQQEQALCDQKKPLMIEKHQQLENHLSDLIDALSVHKIESLASLNILKIEEPLESINRLKLDSEKLQQALYVGDQEVRDSKDKLIGGAIFISGSLLFGIGLYLKQDILKYLAVLLISFGLFKLMNGKAKHYQEDKQVYEEKLAFNENKIKDSNLNLQRDLAFLQLSESDFLNNGQRILALLKQGKSMAQQYVKAKENHSTEEEDLKSAYNHLINRLKALELDEVFFEGDLEAVLESGHRKKIHNEQVSIIISNLQERLQEIVDEENRIENDYKILKSYLETIGNGDLDEGMMQVETINRLKKKRDFLKEGVEEKDPASVLRQNIERRQQELTTVANVKNNKIALRELREEIESLKLKRKTIEKDREHLMKDTDLFEVDSKLLTTREALEEAKETYDQLLALKTVIEAYDREYREEHQPNIHKRTGTYFKQITKNRYPKVYGDDSMGKTALAVRVNGEDLDVENVLSQGGKDQLYLAMRLALADELDKDREKLPLFMDEIFVNWDIDRLDEGILLLEKLSKERQIILFTCHKWMIDKFTSINEPNIILLEP